MIPLPDLMLSANRALWGEVSSRLRALYVKAGEDAMYVKAIYDSGMTEDDEESTRIIGTNIIADFSSCNRIYEENLVIAAPLPIEIEKGWHLVFRRKE